MSKNFNNLSEPLVVAITGASGIGYGLRLVEALGKFHKKPYLILSENAEVVTKVETDYHHNEIKKNAKKI